VGEFARRHAEEIREGIGAQAWGVSFADESLDFPHARAVTQLALDKLLAADSDTDSNADSADVAAPSVAALYLRDADADIHWSTRSSA
jgi:hypothetical protein